MSKKTHISRAMSRSIKWRTVATIFATTLAGAAFFVFITLLWGPDFADAIYAVTLIFMMVFVGATLYGMWSGAPFVPISQSNAQEMIKLAGIGPGDRVADLGSGDGRILIASAKAGATAEGWEINPILWFFSVWNMRLAGVRDKAKAHFKSYWGRDLSDKNVVTLYLITTHMARMEKKLLEELPPGARVVSYAFRFPNWPLAATNGKKMYLYVKSVNES